MAVKNKTAKNIGLMTSIAMLIGSVVGIGIFFKNVSVFAANDYNGLGILISWLITTVIVITTAFSFAEVSSSDRSKAGLASWAAKLLSYRMGRFIKLAMPLFYYGLLNMAIGIFTVESILNVFNINNSINVGWIVFIGFVIVVLSTSFNFAAFHLSKKIQIVATSLKFVPLLVVGISGIIFGIQNPSYDLIINPQGSFNINGVFASIPAILYAFDAFLCVGNFASEMKQPKRDVPLTLVIGMVLCAVAYLLISVSQILSAQGNAYEVMDKASGGSTIAKTFVSVFIMIAILGVINALSAGALRSFESLIDEHLIYKSEVLAAWGSHQGLRAGFILSFFIYGFWALVYLIPSCIINNDAFIDGISNLPALFFFVIYGTVIFGGIINRKTKKVQVDHIKGFMIIAPIAVLGCYFSFCYQLFYANIYDLIINPHDPLSWGMFAHPNEYKVEQYQGAIVFYSVLLGFIAIPIINDLLLKKQRNNCKRDWYQEKNSKLII